MVSICAGCNSYYPWVAAMIASVAGIIYIAISLLMVKLKIDDPLDAVAVHAGSGNKFIQYFLIKNLEANHF